jgi:diguanylate cyclase (GGDEF)-like protein/PAS domain S-box-containing protein
MSFDHSTTSPSAIATALRFDDAMCRLVLETMSDGVVLHDADGVIRVANASALRLLGFTADEAIGRNSYAPAGDLLDEDGAMLDAGADPVYRTLRTRQNIDRTVIGIDRADGFRCWLAVRTVLLLDARGGIRGVVATMSDVTEATLERRELAQLALVARATDDAVSISDRTGRVVWVNEGFVALSGFDVDSLRLRGGTLDGPETDPEERARVYEAMTQGKLYAGELMRYRRDGTKYWVELRIVPVTDGNGVWTHSVNIARDVSARKANARRLLQLSVAFEASKDGIAVIDSFQEVKFANDAFAHLAGHLNGTDLAGKSWRTLYDDATQTRLDDEIYPHLYLHDRWQGEVTGTRADGSTYPQELSITMITGGSMVCIVRDITERRAAVEALKRLSIADQLTGVYNRRGFFMMSEPQLALARRHGWLCVLFYFDLNDFKSINDRFGHHVGDTALQEAAGILRDTFRETDVVARLGGDEFVALAVNCADRSGMSILDRLDEKLAAHNAASGLPYEISIGRGLSVFDPQSSTTLDELLRGSDSDLYADKRARRSQRSEVKNES